MVIDGTALLALCLICVLTAGRLLGVVMGIESNVGGVGIAMLMLILLSARMQRTGQFSRPTQNGVLFESSIYIPIVVAMAASQNVKGALNGGAVAIVAEVLTVVVCFAMVPVVSGSHFDGQSDGSTKPASQTADKELSRRNE